MLTPIGNGARHRALEAFQTAAGLRDRIRPTCFKESYRQIERGAAPEKGEPTIDCSG